jgi:hypothetical protein
MGATKKGIDQIERDLYALSYCTRHIIQLNQIMEMIQYQKKAVHAVKYDKIKIHSNYHFHDVIIDQIEKENAIKQEIQYYIKRINECNFLDKIDTNDRMIILDRYVLKTNIFDICDKYGFSRSGLYKHIHKIFKKIEC